MTAERFPRETCDRLSGHVSGHVPERVLVVDDERDMRDLVLFNLRDAGFEADGVQTGRDGLEAARASRPAVVVLDLMLPDMLGTAVCSAIRHDPSLASTGILMLTARGGENDRIQGLESGADDYMAKPFNNRELVLRVRALARRTSEGNNATRSGMRGATRNAASIPTPLPPEPASAFRWQGLEVEVARRRVTVDGEPLSLRPLEFKLLSTLLPSAGTIFSRADLLRLIWGIEEESESRTVDTHVRRLRERLGPYGEALETVHRFGYRWRDGVESA